MPLTLVTAPAVLPIGLQESKDHLNVDHADHDALIDALIGAAVEQAEGFLGRALITQTWDWKLDRFDAAALEAVPKAPLQSVTSITYTDTAGAGQTWDAAKYRVDTDSQPGRITPAYGESFPSTRAETNAVTARLVAGYGAGVGAVPFQIKAAILIMVADLYLNRESFVVGTIAAKLPQTAETLLWPKRMVNF